VATFALHVGNVVRDLDLEVVHLQAELADVILQRGGALGEDGLVLGGRRRLGRAEQLLASRADEVDETHGVLLFSCVSRSARAETLDERVDAREERRGVRDLSVRRHPIDDEKTHDGPPRTVPVGGRTAVACRAPHAPEESRWQAPSRPLY